MRHSSRLLLRLDPNSNALPATEIYVANRAYTPYLSTIGSRFLRGERLLIFVLSHDDAREHTARFRDVSHEPGLTRLRTVPISDLHPG